MAVSCVLAVLQPTYSALQEHAKAIHFTLLDQSLRHRDLATPVPLPHSRQRSQEQRGRGILDILGLSRRAWEAVHGHSAEDLLAPSEVKDSHRRTKRALSLWATLQTSKPSLKVTARPRQPSKGAGAEVEEPVRPVGKQPLRWGR